jgi:hypothetical protein
MFFQKRKSKIPWRSEEGKSLERIGNNPTNIPISGVVCDLG